MGRGGKWGRVFLIEIFPLLSNDLPRNGYAVLVLLRGLPLLRCIMPLLPTLLLLFAGTRRDTTVRLANAVAEPRSLSSLYLVIDLSGVVVKPAANRGGTRAPMSVREWARTTSTWHLLLKVKEGPCAALISESVVEKYKLEESDSPRMAEREADSQSSPLRRNERRGSR